jgi:hypothetical protein
MTGQAIAEALRQSKDFHQFFTDFFPSFAHEEA